MGKVSRFTVIVTRGFWPCQCFSIVAATKEEAIAKMRRAAPWPTYITFKARPVKGSDENSTRDSG